jgi:hypothetical protein
LPDVVGLMPSLSAIRPIADVRPRTSQRRQWPNRCPRKAGVDDRTTQLTAVEPQTARPAVVGRGCVKTRVECDLQKNRPVRSRCIGLVATREG